MAEHRPADPAFSGGRQGARTQELPGPLVEPGDETQGLSVLLMGPVICEQTPVLRVPMSNPNEGSLMLCVL